MAARFLNLIVDSLFDGTLIGTYLSFVFLKRMARPKRSKMKEYQKRVVQEKKELDEKMLKLKEFFDSDTFKALDEDERFRLHRQAIYMDSYSTVLGERIEAFEK